MVFLLLLYSYGLYVCVYLIKAEIEASENKK